MKKYFKYFVYVSLAFLVYYLVRNDYLTSIKIRNYGNVALSIPFLLMGFIFQALQWRRILIGSGYDLSRKDAIISTGLPIFGKYIPGKVWVILGRASFLSVKLNVTLKEISWLSALSQAFTLFVGLNFGILSLLFYENISDYINYAIVGLIGLSFLLFSKKILGTVEAIIKRVLNKEISLPVLPLKLAVRMFPTFLMTWLFWSTGFYFIISAVADQYYPLYTLGIFPPSASLGILAILVPGGLGVREGIMAGLLTIAGVEPELVVQVSVLQRLWFLFGELFIFILAAGLNNWKIGFGKQQ